MKGKTMSPVSLLIEQSASTITISPDGQITLADCTFSGNGGPVSPANCLRAIADFLNMAANKQDADFPVDLLCVDGKFDYSDEEGWTKPDGDNVQ